MPTDIPNIYRYRLDFGKIPNLIDTPSLLGIQLDSYREFLQKDAPIDKRKDHGLEAVLRSVFPIEDYSKNHKLEYLSYKIGETRYDQKDYKSRGITYSAPLKVNLRLIYFDKESTASPKPVIEIKEQEVYLGDFPMMTDRGSFIINGAEKVVVSQLQKSPGVFFSSDRTKGLNNGKPLFTASIIPQRGSWIDFEFDTKNILYIRFDRKKKILATVFLKALGYNDEQLLKTFYAYETFDLRKAWDADLSKREYWKELDQKSILNQKSPREILHPKTKEVLIQAGKKFNKNHLKKLLDAQVKEIQTDEEDLLGRIVLEKISAKDGKVLVEANQILTKEVLESLIENKIESCQLIHIGKHTIGSSLRETLLLDKITTKEDALLELYRKLRPGDVPLLDAAENLIENMFFNPERYDLSQVGRLKLNRKLEFPASNTSRVLSHDDILGVVRYLLYLRENVGSADDIDHLGNRRVRSVGELIENRFRAGLIRMEKAIKEKMSLQTDESLSITDIVNSKPLLAVVNEFFGSSQLSQFMDQTNPLSEITHKRRLSALGPGGLTRDRAGFEVRDVHNSHYGRICPVETPEGPNIGLISSLACFSKINPYGFIETPYRKVEDGKITKEVHYLSAVEDDQAKIAQSNILQENPDEIKQEFVSARHNGEFRSLAKNEIEYVDLSPKQLVSVAASLVPFLEHDDANRSLMGANMQRQAVPVVRAEAPFVGTGMEHQVAKDSATCTLARRDGVVDSVDASRIVVHSEELDASGKPKLAIDIYHLEKYDRSNQNTCIDQRPLVHVGMKVKKGQIIADGSCTESGELALGQNMLVAFMPWNGYNYEDSILVSEKVLSDDRFTSVHIEELECLARDTKLGNELITADLPNVGEYMLRNLDQTGVVLIGSYVKTGDILVGKVTPKGEAYMNPEEKLLRAIFGEKAGDVKDSSLKVPQGIEGVVIDVKMYNRRGVEKDSRALAIEKENLKKIDLDYRDELRIIRSHFAKLALPYAKKGGLKKAVTNPRTEEVMFKAGSKLNAEALKSIPEESWLTLQLDLEKKEQNELKEVLQNLHEQYQAIRLFYESKITKETRVDDLPPGVIRSVKIYIAVKRRLSVGDKMAGRHGNKGVISRIIPTENMPYLKDGTPIDIVLNPLGVPSRMNVGQVLETQLGLIAAGLGQKIDTMLRQAQSKETIKALVKKIYSSPTFSRHLDAMSEDDLLDFYKKIARGLHVATPVFDGASEQEMHRLMDICGLEHHGKVQLYDGLTGDEFKQKVAIGYMYMMKLHHLVDEKIHARSIGPYSLVTQQPLGGKAHFGGQRFGEMEVWALEAYGAAYTLRELITVKSDDVVGRNKIYEAIVKGMTTDYSGIPESFKVLVNELKSLCIDCRLLQDVRFLEGLVK